MTDFIYEKDLANMKLKILSSPFHTRMVDELSNKYEIRPPVLRKILMENFDMSLLENLPARYNAWKADTCEEGLDREIGVTLFANYIPLIDESEAKLVLSDAMDNIRSGQDRKTAISYGIKEIAGMIRQ